MDTFYDLIMEQYEGDSEYAVFVFHDRYDVPVKAADKERLGESEEVFEYLICTLCPLKGEYEPGPPCAAFSFRLLQTAARIRSYCGLQADRNTLTGMGGEDSGTSFLKSWDTCYFSNCFKKYTGKSIREYRAEPAETTIEGKIFVSKKK